MSAIDDRLSPGSELPPFRVAPITRETLRQYADASGDHAPIHLDTEIARANGFPDVIAHGLLVMAYMGRAVEGWFPGWRMRDFSCRFLAVTLVGDQLCCAGRVSAMAADAGTRHIDLDLQIRNQDGEIKLNGTARVVRG